jgi:hypothetical protein
MPPGKRTAGNGRSAPLTLERGTCPSRPSRSRGRWGGLTGRLVVLLDDAFPRVGGGGRLVVVEDAVPRIGVGWRRLVVPVHAGIVPDGAVRSNRRPDAANGSPRMRQEARLRSRPTPDTPKNDAPIQRRACVAIRDGLRQTVPRTHEA